MTNYISDLKKSLHRYEQNLQNEPRKGMIVYLDKSTPVLVQFSSNENFQQAKKITSRHGQSSCVRNVMDKGGRMQ